ncbi:hypothetical protein QOZ84_09435 [Romboutsia sedimentorum]|uniref:Uncharacterized protein n=1 Tax=Romboutsia sedimentorum TaxID=1368474 RepID=A0ABT7EA23_9FIRM|nr:hypothetical protein [Romboutsia sedimentorum]MDK2563771.1 hypothetical protein [Romboutsia sedimentorum]MDK2586136.1 hypothetical protein [Romboutsia sedimentorum]
MIVLSRENIIQGLIELRAEEENENKLIIDNIKDIINKKEIDNLEKLRLINNELSKVLSA